ncbi:MAG TPA: peptidyl-prolyl cis-trans isomerase [Gemmatimonadota bacterium]|nr:peptidyl-prolyl cis-trans isomerase [Gemmatimonadota bacterium]
MRESTKVIMVIVAISFVGLMVFEWGMDLSGRSSQQGTGTSLGSVNGAEITVDEYQRQYQILYEQAQSEAPEGLSRERLDQIEQQAWEDVVNLTLLRQAADERGIRVTDSELVEYIKYNPPPDLASMPAFQTDGRFDLAKYQAALADPSLEQTWIEYERQLRSTLPIQKLQEQVIAGTFVTEAEARALYLERNERARISYLYVDPAVVARDAGTAIQPEEVRRYYDEHKENYRRGESARVRYVEFVPPITVADSAAARRAADSLSAAARATGADFEALARRHSDDPVSSANGGDVGFMREEALDPAIRAVVAGMSVGEISDPVLTPFGWHVVKLEARSEGQVHLRQIVLAVEPSAESRNAVREAAQEFAREASAAPDAFADAATRRGLRVEEPPVFEKGLVIPGLGSAPDLTDFIFANEAGAVSGALAREDAFYVVQVDQRYPEGYVAMELVADDIRAELADRKRLEAARGIATEIADAIRAEGLEGAAARYGLPVQDTDWFTRVNNIPGIGSGTPVAGAAFGLAQGQAAGPIETSRGLYFIRLIDRQPADEEAFQREKEVLRQELRREKMRERFNAWFDAQRAAAEIEDRRAQLLGV